VLTFVVVTFVRGVPALTAQLSTGVSTIVNWLTTGPLQLSARQLSGVQTQDSRHPQCQPVDHHQWRAHHRRDHRRDRHRDAAGAVHLIFFLHGGPGIWQFLLGVVPDDVRARVDVAGRRGVAALVSYVRATAVVAVVDAVAIGIGLTVLGIPLAEPLAALVFLGAFIPIIGAVIGGSVAVLVALVANGPVAALIVLGIIVAVMQLVGPRPAATAARPRGEVAPAGRGTRHRRRAGRRRHRRGAVRGTAASRAQLRHSLTAQHR
jgi:predicted PurR-regulated permease PerM